MPELLNGFEQGTVLPIYLSIVDDLGELVPQPAGLPTITITYIDENNVIQTAITETVMTGAIEPGRHFFIWNIPEDQPTVTHNVILKAIPETSGLETEEFAFTTNILAKEICFPEVTLREPKCNTRGPAPTRHGDEEDIGLDDRALEGAFRFGEFPNQVVDRRVANRFIVGIGRSGITGQPIVPSRAPGGGPAQRPGGINPQGTQSRTRFRYD